MIQFSKSVAWDDRKELIDGMYLGVVSKEPHFTASSTDDNGELYVYSVDEVDKEIIIKIVKQLKKMCEA